MGLIKLHRYESWSSFGHLANSIQGIKHHRVPAYKRKYVQGPLVFQPEFGAPCEDDTDGPSLSQTLEEDLENFKESTP